tara:strand:- start:244 stop:699 length:456 start_codon:yes stop_codon:yes gene_type:complete
MQLAVVEFARNKAKLKNAGSKELQPETPHPVIDLMEAQKQVADLGGTMRLGSFACDLKPGSRAAASYGSSRIDERHRHRFEFNDEYRSQLEDSGLVVSGVNPETGLVELVELKDHPWFIACQFHPEFKSRPGEAHPLFRDFIGASAQQVVP